MDKSRWGGGSVRSLGVTVVNQCRVFEEYLFYFFEEAAPSGEPGRRNVLLLYGPFNGAVSVFKWSRDVMDLRGSQSVTLMK